MATGSGKTVMMAGLILYLYEQGYRNFLFFVNRGQIVEKIILWFNVSLCVSRFVIFIKSCKGLFLVGS
jgi:hypothetical protein